MSIDPKSSDIFLGGFIVRGEILPFLIYRIKGLVNDSFRKDQFEEEVVKSCKVWECCFHPEKPDSFNLLINFKSGIKSWIFALKTSGRKHRNG